MIRKTLWLAAVVAAASFQTLTSASPALARSEAVEQLEDLLPRMAKGDGGAKDSFQQACFKAARPGADEERAELARAIASKLGPDTPKPARLWLLKQLEHIGRAECVDGLARALEDSDPVVRERARRALQNNPSPEAAERLRDALDEADTDAKRIGLINAIGYRSSRGFGEGRADARAVMKHARRGSDEVRAAAYEAIALTGQSSAASALADGMAQGTERTKRTATDAYLLLADRLADSGDRLKAREMYRKLLDSTGHLKCAAIVGIGRAGGDEGFNIVLDALADKDPEVRGAAVGALEVMPVRDLMRAAEGKMRDGTPEFKAGFLRVLAGRADSEMLPMFVEAAEDGDAKVRLVALEGLAKVGDESTVPLLARTAARGSKEEQAQARRSLGLIRADGVDRALISHMGGAEDDVKAEVIKTLAARRVTSAVPELLTAARDSDDAVRAESFKALATLAGGDSLAALVRLLVRPRADDDRKEAEKAVLAVCRRVEDDEARSAPLLDALGRAPDAAKLSLLRILGKIGGPGALAAVREALRDRNDEIKDAAVRALCDWPTTDAAADLLSLVRTGRNKVHAVLAFRGYVRLAGIETEAGLEGRLAMYERAMDAAPGKEDRKLVLSGLGDVPHLRALKMLEPYLEDNTLGTEAAMAVAKVARGVAGAHRDEAMAALKKVIEVARDENARRQAKEAINIIEKYEDYITAWQVSGPYTLKDRRGKGGNLLDVPLPPEVVEAPGAEKVKWKLWTGGGQRPWFVDFNKLFGGDNRAAYLRGQVYSPKRQEARLEIGSDDGVKVWLGDKVVHRNDASRPCREGEDKKKVTLESGWQRLLVKIKNGGGDWAGCVRIRAVDGSKLEGLRTKAE